MISKRALNKLKNKIIVIMYKQYNAINQCTLNNNDLLLSLLTYKGKLRSSINKHDVYVALRSLVADGFVIVDFGENEQYENITITQTGIEHYQKSSKFFRTHIFDIINLFIALWGAITGTLALFFK